MSAIATSNITLPRSVADEIVAKMGDNSVIQTLSQSTPQLFSDVSHVLFTKEPEAEILGEGAQHGSSSAEFEAVPGNIKKAHVTVRMDQEVQWADEDNQLRIIDAITDASAKATARALDYLVLHAINPATGLAISGMTGLCSAAGVNVVDATTDPSADLDSLSDALQNSGYDISGLAMAKAYASELRKLRTKNGNERIYPEIPLNLMAASVDGIAAATSNTVSGALAKTATNVKAIMGDFNLIKWGIVRDLGMEIITMGDPDGLGDLKRLGQVAYRLEVVYGYATLDPSGFAVLKTKPASDGKTGETGDTEQTGK
ncbi:phage major capsid protein [Olsenella sp. KGMB02461]|nr:phage major capsid protein [Olsenella sp. KGMB02461]